MFQKEINFDRFVRGAILVGVLVLLGLAVHALSSVLLPFALAWVLAYMINPIVTFLQVRCFLHFRWLSVFVTLLLLCGIGVGVFIIVVPPSIEEFSHLRTFVIEYIRKGTGDANIPVVIADFLREHMENEDVIKILQANDFSAFIRQSMEYTTKIVGATASLLWNLFSWGFTIVYLIFLLLDFERASKNWLNYIPKQWRETVEILAQDVQKGMSAYFRGQALVALCVGIFFAVGFSIIDLPLAIGFGLFVGLLNFVPYLQVVSIPIAVLLVLLKSVETGENFWGILLPVIVVYIVVQVIQDLIIVPRIMGKIMGLSPALVLLSLSVWGYIGGFLGLIIALPLTTLILSCYKRYIIKD